MEKKGMLEEQRERNQENEKVNDSILVTNNAQSQNIFYFWKCWELLGTSF